LSALAHIAGDEKLLDRFIAISGADGASLRSGASDPVFLAGVLDFLMSDEAALVAFCDHAQFEPDAPARARAVLPGASPDW